MLPALGVGLLGGALVGMTGVGAGSVIAALLLVFYPEMPPQVIVGSATTQAVIMKLAGVWVRRKFQLGERALGFAMALGAIPCAALGAWASSRLDAAALRPVMAAVLVIVGVLLILEAIRGRGASAPPVATPGGDPTRGGVLALGSVVGFIAGLTSIGTGTLFVSALAGPLRVDAHRAVAAALVAGLLTLVVSAGTHMMLGHVDTQLALLTCLGSVPGVIFGTAAGQKLPARSLRGVVGVMILVAAALAVFRLGK